MSYVPNVPASKYIRYCFVPSCRNNSRICPTKHFFSVPKSDIRKEWLIAVNRNSKISDKSTFSICEDHFNIEEDTRNWMYYKLMGGTLHLKKDVIPHIFPTEIKEYKECDCGLGKKNKATISNEQEVSDQERKNIKPNKNATLPEEGKEIDQKTNSKKEIKSVISENGAESVQKRKTIKVREKIHKRKELKVKHKWHTTPGDIKEKVQKKHIRAKKKTVMQKHCKDKIRNKKDVKISKSSRYRKMSRNTGSMSQVNSNDPDVDSIKEEKPKNLFDSCIEFKEENIKEMQQYFEKGLKEEVEENEEEYSISNYHLEIEDNISDTRDPLSVVQSMPLVAEEGNTADTCDPLSVVQSMPLIAEEGNTADTCDPLSVVHSMPLVAEEGNTADTCDPLSVVQSMPLVAEEGNTADISDKCDEKFENTKVKCEVDFREDFSLNDDGESSPSDSEDPLVMSETPEILTSLQEGIPFNYASCSDDLEKEIDNLCVSLKETVCLDKEEESDKVVTYFEESQNFQPKCSNNMPAVDSENLYILVSEGNSRGEYFISSQVFVSDENNKKFLLPTNLSLVSEEDSKEYYVASATLEDQTHDKDSFHNVPDKESGKHIFSIFSGIQNYEKIDINDVHRSTVHTNSRLLDSIHGFQTNTNPARQDKSLDIFPTTENMKEGSYEMCDGSMQTSLCEIMLGAERKQSSVLDGNVDIFVAVDCLSSDSRAIDKKKIFQCQVCDKYFIDKFSLKKHSKIHPSVKVFCCDVCQRKYISKSALILHLLTHRDIRPKYTNIFECNECHKCFRFKGSLKFHMKLHTNLKYYNCNICQRYFQQKTDIKKHIERHMHDRNCKKRFYQRLF